MTCDAFFLSSSDPRVVYTNMCSSQEVIPDLKSKDTLTQRSKLSCLRCQGDNVNVLLRGSDTYCQPCFVQDAYHRFRSTIGKARAVKPGDTILLAYSGGPTSGSMLAMVKESMKDNIQHRKLMISAKVLYIDEGILFDCCPEDRSKLTRDLATYVSSLSFEFFAVGLEYSLTSDADFPVLRPYKDGGDGLMTSLTLEAELKQLFSVTSTLTSKEELLVRLRNKVLTQAAHKLGISKAFVASTGSRLAAQLLISVSQGRGGQIPQEMGFSDERNSHVRVLRPLREFTDREIGYFSHFLSIPSFVFSTLTTKAPSNATIAKQIEGFVATLEHNFPSTTYTLFRTGDKIAAHKGRGKEAQDFCLLCHSTLEACESSCSAQQARLFSQIVSAVGPERLRAQETEFLQMNDKQLREHLYAMQAPPSANSGCGSSSCSSRTTKNSEWKKYLCYACKITMEDVKEVPAFLLSTAQDALEHERRERMREQIENFLL